MTLRVSIIIVTYNSRPEVDDAINSAVAAVFCVDGTADVIVVDNASQDGTAAHVAHDHADVRLVENSTNTGFGSANNQAFELATGAVWLLVNPDARLDIDAVSPLRAVLEQRPRAALVAPTVDGPGEAESAGMLPSVRSAIGHFLFVNRLLRGSSGGAFRGFQLRKGRGRDPVRVEWASAAVLAVRPEAIREVGGFDESIFLYGEDLDLADRLARAGWEAWLVPEARAWHGIGASSAGISTRWVDGLDEFLVRREASRFRRATFHAVVAAGLAIRAIGGWRPADAAVRRHRARMRAGSARALVLAARALIGRRAGPG